MNKLKFDKRMVIKLVLIVVAIAAVSTGGLLAVITDTENINQNLITGKVDINAVFDMKTDTGYAPYERPKFICPGTPVNQRLTVTNDGNDCFIRIKFDFDVDVKELKETMLDKDFLALNAPEDWTLITQTDGVYLYYNKIFTENESLIVYDGFNIPNWNNKSSGTNITADIFVQAIQSKNVTQDLNSDNPWGSNVKIEEYIPKS